jgi:hypothetical protein
MRARACVPDGEFSQISAGDTSLPSAVYARGILPPGLNADDEIEKAMELPPCSALDDRTTRHPAATIRPGKDFMIQ